MGLFDFVKSAGKKLFGSDEDNSAAEAIEKEVADLGLEGDVDITVDGDKVTIAGAVPSQEAKEKIILAAGNVAGVATVDETIETPSGPLSQFHTVAKGDTLWAIAKEFYGDGNQYNVIFEANRPMLSHPDKIYPGQVLRIPPLAG